MQRVTDIDLKGKTVLLRADFNVPLNDDLTISDDGRIKAVMPTINHCLEQGAGLIVCSHMGRPKGQRVDRLSLRPVAERLSELLGWKVPLAPDCIGPEVEKMARAVETGQVLCLENLRFQAGETKNNAEMGRQLAGLADVYVNDAFATAHRAHASNVAVAKAAKEKAAGFLLMNEIDYFNRALENPARPLTAIVGGAKIDTKLGALENLMTKVDRLIIGGAMANTFLKCQGLEIGASLHEPDLLPVAACLLKLAQERKVKLYLPVDCVAADKPDNDAVTKCLPVQDVPAGWYIMDVGPATSLIYGQVMNESKTIVWNGPVGAFEMDKFSAGTTAACTAAANAHALTIIGGGDTAAAVQKAGLAQRMSYISTGGGAFLTLLEGAPLPGFLALEDRFEEIDNPPKTESLCAPSA